MCIEKEAKYQEKQEESPLHLSDMAEIEDSVFEYINETLFTLEKPVLFTDLIFRYKIGPSRSKKLMYSYYKQNTAASFNCVIVTCYDNGCVKVVHDMSSLGDETSVIDCFIYAFNPMEKFIPVNKLVDQHECLTIRNPHKVAFSRQRAKTVEETTAVRIAAPVSRSKTVPEKTEAKGRDKAKPATKSSGLRSTAILAKMRAERESKEAERQEELRKRREEDRTKAAKSNPKSSAQMEELKSLFDEEDEEDAEDAEDAEHEISMEDSATSPATAAIPSPSNEDSAPIDKKELEDLLETTAEESAIASQVHAQVKESQTEEPVSSFVDDDGYIVTNRAATSTPPQSSRKRPSKSTPASSSAKKISSATKKTQGTLESFFKKSKK